MELKVYLQILLKKWWVVIPTSLVTLTMGIILTYTQTPMYSASATYVVVPSTLFGSSGSDFGKGLDLLSRRVEIATTFSEIAASDRIKNLALEKLSVEGKGYEVNSKLVAGTNILDFTVEGPDPTIARDLANEIGETTEEYVQGLYEVFVLLPLDEATAPRRPFSPNVFLNITLAAIFGLTLGAGLAFLAEYLETPLTSPVNVNIIDGETGLYNKPYFLQRLTAEMVRAKRNRYPLSLALMQIDNLDLIKGSNASKIRTEILRQMALLAGQYLREEDILAYLEKHTFAFLLPDMTGENAKAVMEYLQARLAWAPLETASSDLKFNPISITGIAAYNHNDISRNELIAQAQQALQLAEAEGKDKAYLVTELATAS